MYPHPAPASATMGDSGVARPPPATPSAAHPPPLLPRLFVSSADLRRPSSFLASLLPPPLLLFPPQDRQLISVREFGPDFKGRLIQVLAGDEHVVQREGAQVNVKAKTATLYYVDSNEREDIDLYTMLNMEVSWPLRGSKVGKAPASEAPRGATTTRRPSRTRTSRSASAPSPTSPLPPPPPRPSPSPSPSSNLRVEARRRPRTRSSTC